MIKSKVIFRQGRAKTITKACIITERLRTHSQFQAVGSLLTDFYFKFTHHTKVYWWLWLERQQWPVMTTPPPLTLLPKNTYLCLLPLEHANVAAGRELMDGRRPAAEAMLLFFLQSLKSVSLFPLHTALHCTVNVSGAGLIFYICIIFLQIQRHSNI